MVIPANARTPALRRDAQGVRSQRAGGREDNGRVELLRWCLFGSAGPDGSELFGKFAMRASAREHVDFTALVTS